MKSVLFTCLVVGALLAISIPVRLYWTESTSEVIKTPVVESNVRNAITVANIDYKPVDRNDTFEWFSYKFDLKNTSASDVKISYRVRFIDRSGFQIAMQANAFHYLQPGEVMYVTDTYPVDVKLSHALDRIRVEVIQH